MSGTHYFIERNAAGRFVAKVEGGSEPDDSFPTQDEAVEYARKLKPHDTPMWSGYGTQQPAAAISGAQRDSRPRSGSLAIAGLTSVKNGHQSAAIRKGVGMKATWKPHEEHGKLSSAERKDLPDSVYAFPKRRKEPLVDASHVREALARFDQVKDVTDEERYQAFANIQSAAQHYQISLSEKSWRDLEKRSSA